MQKFLQFRRQWCREFLSPRKQYSVDVMPLEIRKVCCTITNSRAMASSKAKQAPTKHSAILKTEELENCATGRFQLSLTRFP